MRLINKYYIGEEVWYCYSGRPKKSSILSIHSVENSVSYLLMDASTVLEPFVYPTESACQADLYKYNLKRTVEQLKELQEQCADLLSKIKIFLREEV